MSLLCSCDFTTTQSHLLVWLYGNGSYDLHIGSSHSEVKLINPINSKKNGLVLV